MIYTSLVLAQNSTQLECVKGCSNTDVNCQAKCLGNPFPDAELVAKTTKCYQDCGTDLNCRNSCQNNFVEGVGVPVNGSSTTNTTSTDKKSSAVVISASTLVLSVIAFY